MSEVSIRKVVKNYDGGVQAVKGRNKITKQKRKLKQK